PMEVRLPVTAIPVLAGFVPGVTLTVRSVEPPATSRFGLAAPLPEGLVEGAATASEMVVLPVRAWASVIVAGRVFAPALVPPATAAWNENTLSPDVTSP